jgi:hypothetical protein
MLAERSVQENALGPKLGADDPLMPGHSVRNA